MCELFEYTGDNASAGYRNLFQSSDSPNSAYIDRVRYCVSTMWNDFEPHADSHFKSEFAINIDQRYWEMYLGYCLLKQGFSIESADDGPDFKIATADLGTIWIEAVSPRVGDSENPDRLPQRGNGIHRVAREKVILRQTSGIVEKLRKFEAYAASENIEVNVNDVQIIAISRGELRTEPDGDSLPFIVQALYGVGCEVITIDPFSGDTIGAGREYRPELIRGNRSSVRTDFFMTPEYSNISAIIYHNSDIGNPPLFPGTDIIVIHNPYARVSIPRGFFRFSKEYWLEEREGRRSIHNASNPVSMSWDNP